MKKLLIILLTLFMITGCGNNTNTDDTIDNDPIVVDNKVKDFDLAFLKLENKETNLIYSPLSIKYCLAILSEGANGDTKTQIDNVLDGYVPKTYTNSKHLSLANLVAIKDDIEVNPEFEEVLGDKYRIGVTKESFSDPTNINNWIDKKTFGMIDNYIDSFDSNLKFLILNALAIDMDWLNKIQNHFYYYGDHIFYGKHINQYAEGIYTPMAFNGKIVKGTEFTTVCNRYDIINSLGEENIRKTVENDLRQHLEANSNLLESMEYDYRANGIDEVISNYLESYMKSISKNYQFFDSSTDFYYYVDDSIKVFAKDLKEYDGTQFQFVSILPKNESLNKYISKLTLSDVETLINKVKTVNYDDFEEGYITEIQGFFPTFKFDCDLDLNEDLEKLGLTNIFDPDKADFSKMVGDEKIAVDTKHKSTIELSNDGIKAAAITELGGLGAAGSYDYLFEVPVKIIDLRFDEPFLFLIRNKDTNEIFFIGTLYETELGSATVSPKVYDLKVRKEPSISSKELATADYYESYVLSGNVTKADGYTWYELKDGGWLPDNGELLNIYR